MRFHFHHSKLSKNFKYFFGTFLIVFILGTWIFNVNYFNKHKEPIIIYLAEILEEIALPYRIARMNALPKVMDLPLPIRNLRARDVDDTWGEARAGGRSHEGTDIFAKRGTEVYSVTEGYVVRAGTNELGGNIVFVAGPGGVRYYYAHLDGIASGIDRGEKVTTDTVLGFVGNSGNASTTPPHLHFGVYDNAPQNPYPLLRDR